MSADRSLQILLDELGRLPGIGPKSAQRIAYHLLEADVEEARRLADAILMVKNEVHFCSRCFNYATDDECAICEDMSRERDRICVVGEPRDVTAIERTGSYRGLYHVLGGVISPMDKIGPEQLHVRELLARLGSEDIEEVIIATNPNIEGETTASYLARTIKPLGITVTRLASGLPVGGDLEYADELTLGRAIEARRACRSGLIVVACRESGIGRHKMSGCARRTRQDDFLEVQSAGIHPKPAIRAPALWRGYGVDLRCRAALRRFDVPSTFNFWLTLSTE